METKTILKAHKVRLYPTAEQEVQMAKTFGCVRFVYNYMLARQQENYKTGEQYISNFTMQKEVVKLKDELPWLRGVDSQALKEACGDLDAAYKHFFKKEAGRPKFKSKKLHRHSYTSPRGTSIHLEEKRIKLPTLGWVKCRGGAPPLGVIKRATVSKTPSGKYYASILYEALYEVPDKLDTVIGLDVGIKEFATDSNGNAYSNPKYYKKALSKLAKEQRKLSRKTKGSANWEKQRIKVARCHEKVASQRHDFLHKLSTQLVNENQVICVEDLNVEGMLHNHKLAVHISDASWGEFFRLLEYKCGWNERALIKVPTFYPSSQTCGECGYQNKEVKDLKIRQWTCPHCGAYHDRDVNAANNILKKGVGMLTLPISA